MFIFYSPIYKFIDEAKFNMGKTIYRFVQIIGL